MSEYVYPFYIMIHPIEGVYEAKYNKKFSYAISFIILICWAVISVVEWLETGFIFNYRNLEDLNIYFILFNTIGLFTIWVTANWMVTTLMDGKGKYGEIWVMTSYCLIPSLIATTIVIIMSNYMIMEEAVFLQWILTIGQGWSLLMLVFGMMVIHEYTFSKTIGSLILTLAVLVFIIFLGTLLIILFQQLIDFLQTIFDEILKRL